MAEHTSSKTVEPGLEFPPATFWRFPLPLYFFDTFNGKTWINDEDCLDCDHDDAAQAHAHVCLSDIAKDKVPDGVPRAMIVRVRDIDGPLMEAHLDLHTIWLR